MMRLLIAVTLVAAASATDSITLAADSFGAGTYCSDCAPVADRNPDTTLTCKTGSATEGTVRVSPQVCAAGFLFTAGSGTGHDTCVACEANCNACTSDTDCTAPKAGFLDGADPVACTAVNVSVCTADATNKVVVSDPATLCPADNTFTAQADDVAGSGSKPAGCTTCDANSSPNAEATAGCTPCPAIANAATGATRTCAANASPAIAIGQTGTVALVAATGTWGTTAVTTAAPHPGRQCAPGFFYTAPVTTADSEANATCTACETGCITCTSDTNCSAEGAASGYFVTAADAVPTACTARTAEECAAVADSDKFPRTVGATNPVTGVCFIDDTGVNTMVAQVTDGTGCDYYTKACPASVDSASASAPSMFAVLVAAAVALRM